MRNGMHCLKIDKLPNHYEHYPQIVWPSLVARNTWSSDLGECIQSGVEDRQKGSAVGVYL